LLNSQHIDGTEAGIAQQPLELRRVCEGMFASLIREASGQSTSSSARTNAFAPGVRSIGL
jgi:hypothetical protein